MLAEFQLRLFKSTGSRTSINTHLKTLGQNSGYLHASATNLRSCSKDQYVQDKT